MTKNKAKAKKQPEADLSPFEKFSLPSFILFKSMTAYFKIYLKTVCRFNEIIWLIMMKTKMENRSHRCDINRLRPRCTKYKTCFSMMMLKCVRQQISNICSSFHEKVKRH